MRSTDFYTNRLVELLQLIAYIRPTRAGVLKASSLWQKPFKSQSRCNSFIRKYIEKSYITEQEVLLPGDARNPRLLYLKPKAAEIWPDLQPLADLHENNQKLNLFKPTDKRQQLHQLGLSEFCAELWAGFSTFGQSFQLIEALSTDEFKAKVMIKTRGFSGKDTFIPDYTVACLIHGKPKLLFIELQHKTSSIQSNKDHRQLRTFQHKLTRYKAFLPQLHDHPIIRKWEQTHHIRFENFQVLIPTLQRSPIHLNNLMATNHGTAFDDTFLFAHLHQLENQNVITQPVWRCTSGKARSILGA